MNTFRPRQFSQGTDAEWDRVLQEPAVQRALNDPQVGPALARLVPQGAVGFADGGSVGVPDPMEANKWQQLQDALRSEEEPMRFQGGGSTADPGQLARLPDSTLGQMYLDATDEMSRQKILSAIQMKHPEGIGGGAGTGLAIPGVAGGQPLTGLSKLTGPATTANTVAPAVLAGLTGLGAQGNMSTMGRVGGALLSAAMAAVGNRLIRHYAQKHQQDLANQGSSSSSTSSTTSGGAPPPTPPAPGNLPTPAQIATTNAPGVPPSATTQTTGDITTDDTGTLTPEEKKQAFEEGQPTDLAKKMADIKKRQGIQYDEYGFRPRPDSAPATTDSSQGYNPLRIPGADTAPIGGGDQTSLPGMAPTPQARTPADYRPPTETSPTSAYGPADPGTPLGPPGLPPTREHPHGVPDPVWQKEHPEDYPLSDYARGGEVHGDAAQDRQQMLGILKEKGLLKKARGGKFAEGAAEDVPPPPSKKGKSVLLRKPVGPIPVLHTTIIIAKPIEKEKKKKAKGGTIVIPRERLDTRARRPRAIPPKKGPMNGEQYAPFKKGGHVQVPRGSGVATKGKSFSGIY